MYKAIVFSRISTEGQNFDAQTEDVKRYALESYKEEDILVIEYHESGSKLADDDRQGLVDLTNAIDDPNNDIECVFIAELSRLSRIPQTLYKWKSDFIKKRINLRIKDVNMSLLNEYGKTNDIDLLFSIYSGLTEKENRDRVERCIRGRRKKAKERENSYTGGTVPFGYHYDKKNKILDFHPEEKQIVSDIFELYRTGKYGHEKIYTILKNEKGYNVPPTLIGKILRNKDYTGEAREAKEWKILINKEGKALKEDNKIIKIAHHHFIKITKTEIQILDENKNKIRTIQKSKDEEITEKTESRFKKSFKKIIEPHVFEECRKIAEKNNTNLQKRQTVYFAHRLIRCSECNGFLKALKPKMLYRCQHSYNVVEEKNCKGKDSININAIDWILWYLSKDMEITFRKNLNINQITEWEKEIEIYQSKLDACDKRYQNLIAENRKKFEIVEIFTEQQKDEYAIKETEKRKKGKKEKELIEADRKEYIKEIDRLSRLIMVSKDLRLTFSDDDKNQEPLLLQGFPIMGREIPHDFGVSKLSIIKNAVEKTTDRQRYDIIHKHIKEIRVFNEPKGVKKIEIYFYDDSQPKTFYYAGMKKDKSKRLYYIIDNVPQYIEYENRIE